MAANDDTFIKITNKDIYTKMEEFIKANQKEHQEISSHVQRTNGRVKMNKWIATTALSLCITAIGWLFILI
jgi:hypothetical protein